MTPRSRGIVVLVAALAGTAITARLGAWQLDRAAQKTALQSALDTRAALPPLAAFELAADATAAAAQWHRAVRLTGRWREEATVLLDNRQMRGRPGFFVVTPLLLADGSAVLVQRGWMPRDFTDRTRVQPPPLPVGEVTVFGRMAPSPPRLLEFEPAASGAIRQNLALPAFAAETGLPLRPFTVLQLDAPPLPGSSPDGLLRDWPRPAADVHKHYGYAFQWFALAGLILGLYVWFQLVRPRRGHR